MRIADFNILQGYAKKYASQYALANPFPHIVIDNFFPFTNKFYKVYISSPRFRGLENSRKCSYHLKICY